MKKISVKDIVKSTNAKFLFGDNEHVIEKISIDSREVDKDSLFVAIKGENRDGHEFVESAYKNGCRTFLISDEKYSKGLDEANVILVKNTEIALGDIARFYRNQFKIPFVGVTGSVGKTTTRDMIYAVVSSKFKTLKNEKNFNNQFGVPMTLFNLSEEHECAIIEMGMCGFGEIEYLVNIVEPQMAVISNIGMSHIELLGSREGILKAKMEIASKFDKNNLLIVNNDDDMLRKVVHKDIDFGQSRYNIKSFGKNEDSDIRLLNYKSIGSDKTEFTVSLKGNSENIVFEIPTVGEHNVYNAMSAILVGLNLGIEIERIRSGLMNFKATKDRQDIVKMKNFTVINDVYNASPDSMIASINVMGLFDNRKVVILGDCLEMGEYAQQGHRRVGESCVDKVDLIITTGDAAKYIGCEASNKGFDEANIHHFETKSELISSLKSLLQKDDVILVKASRGMKFEDIVNYIEEEIN